MPRLDVLLAENSIAVRDANGVILPRSIAPIDPARANSGLRGHRARHRSQVLLNHLPRLRATTGRPKRLAKSGRSHRRRPVTTVIPPDTKYRSANIAEPARRHHAPKMTKSKLLLLSPPPTERIGAKPARCWQN